MIYPNKMDCNKTIFHFTDIEALKSILETRNMRFAYYKDLNDSGEIYSGLNTDYLQPLEKVAINQNSFEPKRLP